ncbi:MAG TPA: cytochrome c [Opitutus sp.]|nr:cytochrome c [Opitutus sp.]
MSDEPLDPRVEQPGASDDSLVSAHEETLHHKSGGDAHYKMLPLVLLFVFSGLIFFGGTYLNRFAGHYHPEIFNEYAQPTNAAAAPVKVDPVVLGKKSFEQVCITCHQATGLGVPGVYPPLAGSEWVLGTPDRVIRIVLYGLKGPVTVKGNTFGAAAMPVIGKVTGSGYNWSDERIAAVLTYVRQEWGNKASPITPEQVAAIHEKEGDRKEWSAEELEKIQ